MEFTLLDRIALTNNILPKEGSFDDLIIAKEINTKVGVTGEELAKYEIKAENKTLVWNQNGAEARFEYEFTELEKKLIASVLTKMNEEKKGTVDMLHLYELFK